MVIDFEHSKDSAEGAISVEGLEALRRRIGIEIPQVRPGHEYASFDGIRNYSEGIGDKNPLYRDRDYAQKTRWKGLIAHPTFMLYMGVSEKKRLTPEEREVGEGGGLPGVHSFFSGADIDWIKPIREGDRLTCRGGLADIQEKPSQTADLAIHQWTERAYWNQRGQLVGVARHLSIRYERSKSRERRSHLDIPLHHYTADELAAIDADYEKEEIRGAKPRFWEDVNVGDEMVPLVKGPWCVSCFLIWQSGTGIRSNFYRAHSLRYEYRKRHPRAFPLNEFGFPDIIARVHWDPVMARVTGQPHCYDQGGERISWISHACTNWMGDDGFLRRLSVRLRHFVYTGDVIRISGRVTKKYVHNGEHFIELEINAMNQNGIDVAPSKAWILLPSRTDGPVKIPVNPPETKFIFV